MKNIIVIISLLTFASCLNNNQDVKATIQNDSTKLTIKTDSVISKKLILDFFKSVPDTIDGCGEYFTYDTCKVSNDKYVFISNLSFFAIIKVDGKNIFLNRDSVESKEINDKSYKAVYVGQGYKAILTVAKTKDYDEGGFYAGTLEIIINDKEKFVFKVHGESGC